MGLDVSHGCWHGAYSAFMTWRTQLAKVANLPPLELMEGFYSNDSSLNPFWAIGRLSELERGGIERLQKRLPISWECLKPDPLYELLYHSDCDGELPWQSCKAIAKRLAKLIPLLPKEPQQGHIGDWALKTQTFVDGLLRAHELQEDVRFR